LESTFLSASLGDIIVIMPPPAECVTRLSDVHRFSERLGATHDRIGTSRAIFYDREISVAGGITPVGFSIPIVVAISSSL
jgi:hypothetical protein